MKNRRGFLTVLTALSSAGLGLVMAAKTDAQADAAAPPVKRRKGPTAAALALAATYRGFDPRLTDADVQTIAHAIDDNRAASSALNPKTKPLRNSDEMVARFAAAESIRG